MTKERREEIIKMLMEKHNATREKIEELIEEILEEEREKQNLKSRTQRRGGIRL